MPLAGYFRNVGAALFALLLLADLYLPAPAIVQTAPVHSAAIHIHSERKLPAPVVFDTTQATVVAAVPAPWDRNPPAPPVAMNPALREAFAQLKLPDPRAATAEPRKRQPARRYAARTYAPRTILAARQGQFGWFSLRAW
jgi:hypothetical protein